MKNILLISVLALFSSIVFGQEAPDTTVRTDQYGKKVDRTPLITENRDGILVFESKDQSYRLHLQLFSIKMFSG